MCEACSAAERGAHERDLLRANFQGKLVQLRGKLARLRGNFARLRGKSGRRWKYPRLGDPERQKHQPVSAFDAKWLGGLTVQLVTTIREEIGVVGFWKNAHAQEVARSAIFTFLDDHEIVPFDRADAVADRLLELAKANHAKLMKS
jgi:hypothetical protein